MGCCCRKNCNTDIDDDYISMIDGRQRPKDIQFIKNFKHPILKKAQKVAYKSPDNESVKTDNRNGHGRDKRHSGGPLRTPTPPACLLDRIVLN